MFARIIHVQPSASAFIFAANDDREGEVHPLDCQLSWVNMTQGPEKLEGKIDHSGFAHYGVHGKIKVIDQLSVTKMLHAAIIDIFQKFLINRGLWQRL